MNNAPNIMQVIQSHIQQHMRFMSHNQQNQTATMGNAAPGAPQPIHPALGHTMPLGQGNQPPPALQ